MTRGDLRLVAHALKARWPVPKELRKETMRAAKEILSDPEADARARVAAGKLVIEADKLNMEQEKRDAGGEHVTHHIDGQVEHTITARLAEYDRLLGGLVEGANRNGEAHPSGNGTGKPLDS